MEQPDRSDNPLGAQSAPPLPDTWPEGEGPPVEGCADEREVEAIATPVKDLSEDLFWRVEQADNFAMLVDGSEYFGALRQAMLDAEHSILLLGWDFDSRVRFVKDANPPQDDGPEALGDFLIWLADRRPNLRIRLLRWGTGALASMLRPSALWAVLRWKAHRQITLKLDYSHPLAGSHHQKIVAIDDRLAFCGGIDTTLRRWDTREHLDNDPLRIGPNGKRHDPWHDISSVFDGAAAAAIGDMARSRWKTATGKTLPPCPSLPAKWPKGLRVDAVDLRMGIARAFPKWGEQEPILEVERVVLGLIASAKDHIYVENQYFASRRIAQAMAMRLIEPDGPEIVVVCPQSAEGWLEPLAMNTARTRLMQALERLDTAKRLRLYHPVTRGGAEIYVHAKVIFVDGRYLRVGSSNFNNRSMRLDTECDVVMLEGRLPPDAPHWFGQPLPAVRLRDELLAEHMGVTPEEVAREFAQTGSLLATIDALNQGPRRLMPFDPPELSGIEEWFADNEILDPDGPDEMFELSNRRGLFRGWGAIARRKIALRKEWRLPERLGKVRTKITGRGGGAGPKA